MPTGHTTEEDFIKILMKNEVPVSIYLVNGIKLQGKISGFDAKVFMLKNGITQLIYKHAVSTVVPMQNITVE